MLAQCARISTRVKPWGSALGASGMRRRIGRVRLTRHKVRAVNKLAELPAPLLDRHCGGAEQRSTSTNQAPHSKLWGMNCAFPSSRFPTGLRRKRLGIRPEEIEITIDALGGQR